MRFWPTCAVLAHLCGSGPVLGRFWPTCSGDYLLLGQTPLGGSGAHVHNPNEILSFWRNASTVNSSGSGQFWIALGQPWGTRGFYNRVQGGRGRAERASPAVLRCFLSWRLDYGPWPGPERLPPHFPVLPTPWGLEWLPPWFQEWRCNKGVLTQPRCQTRTDSSTHLKDEVFSHPHHLSPPLPQTPASLYPPQPAVSELL